MEMSRKSEGLALIFRPVSLGVNNSSIISEETQYCTDFVTCFLALSHESVKRGFRVPTGKLLCHFLDPLVIGEEGALFLLHEFNL